MTLKHVLDWSPGVSCTPTALAAITGLPLSIIGLALQQAAAEFEVQIGPQLRGDYDINHSLRALRNLGYSWEQDEDHSAVPFEERLSTSRWLAKTDRKGLYLVMSTNKPESEGPVGHVFALEDSELVDEYTRGIPTRPVDVPNDFDEFRPKLVFRLRRTVNGSRQ